MNSLCPAATGAGAASSATFVPGRPELSVRRNADNVAPEAFAATSTTTDERTNPRPSPLPVVNDCARAYCLALNPLPDGPTGVLFEPAREKLPTSLAVDAPARGAGSLAAAVVARAASEGGLAPASLMARTR